MKQSAELTAFYRDYLEWARAGAPVDNKWNFCGRVGLCRNIQYRGQSFTGRSDWDLINAMKEEMTIQFRDAGLDWGYPFDGGDPDAYYDHSRGLAMPLHPKRIAWVEEHAGVDEVCPWAGNLSSYGASA